MATRYATVPLLPRGRPSTSHDAEQISLWMCSNRLKLNTEKTQFTRCGTRYQLAKVDDTGFMVNGSAVTLLPTVTCLGVIMDQEMLFADHVRHALPVFVSIG